MLSTYLKSLINEKVQIIARRKIRRSLTGAELMKFNNRTKPKFNVLMKQFKKDVDKIIGEYLDENFSD